MPSPQTPSMLHTLGEPEQVQPAGIWQIALQPSPAVLLPSSHCSPVSITPLPQLVGLMSMPSMPGRASKDRPVPPLPVLPPLPPWPPGFMLTPAQPPTALVRIAAATRERTCPLRLGDF
jgi:hypothetical protein